jgi:4-hydroxyphenylpyruvate dioxygenase
MSEFSQDNPCGLDGVDFVEYAGPQSKFFEVLFKKWGFVKVGYQNNKNISLFRQNDINFIISSEAGSFADKFARKHGNSICATGFRVRDAKQAYETAVARGARPFTGSLEERGFKMFPAIFGIGDSLIYFIDKKNSEILYSEIFQVKPENKSPRGVGFEIVDHFTNNVPAGEMQKWCDFYSKIFNFRETRYFDIRGKQTGLISKVMRSPCGKFAIPINEPTGEKSQIQEYLDEYKGSGIQHLALTTPNIVQTLTALKDSQLEFLTPPPSTYYAALKDRVPGVTEEINTLQKNAVLVDGDHEGYLLQIFSKNIIGPIFFEVIQRKGHSGFGEGNFQALFDAIERDQKERGYL